MECSVCGSEINEKLSFCTNCGATVKFQSDNENKKYSENNNHPIISIIDPAIIKAREAYNNKKYKLAQELFDEALMNNPNSIEASIFGALSQTKKAYISNNKNELFIAIDLLNTKISFMQEKYDENDRNNAYVFSTFYNELTHLKIGIEDVNLWSAYSNVINRFIDFIYSINKENNKLFLSVILLKHCSTKIETAIISKNDYNVSIIDVYNEEMKRLEDNYPEFLKRNSFNPPKTTGSCYIATAVYGSYDCPEVWVLRRFRDNELSTTMFGRLFITLYYAVSPIFIKIFGHTKIFNYFGRSMLDSWVNKLKERGYEDTCYYD